MNYKIEIKVEQTHPRLDPIYMQVEGFVNGRSQVLANNHINKVWHIVSSSALPSELEHARAIVDCMNQVLAKIDELRVAREVKVNVTPN